MRNGDISDDQISSSTDNISDTDTTISASNGRLDNNNGYWRAGDQQTTPWFQVNFDSMVIITKIKVQGNGDMGSQEEYILTLQVKYGEGNEALNYIMDGSAIKVHL